MRVAVHADLVALLKDAPHFVGVALGYATRDKERRRQPLLGKQGEDQLDGDLRAVRALREDTGTRGVGRILADPHLLGVEVEGEHEGRLMHHRRPLSPATR